MPSVIVTVAQPVAGFVTDVCHGAVVTCVREYQLEAIDGTVEMGIPVAQAVSVQPVKVLA